jgi:hypothetical protein
VRNLQPCERETHISFDNEGKSAQIYTLNHALQLRLLKLCENHPGEIYSTDTYRDGEQPMTFYLPKKWVKIHAPRKASAAQLAGLKAARKKKAENDTE